MIYYDAERVTNLKNPKYKTGWNVQATYEKDRGLIKSIQDGYISKR